ncbi:hypothetical protein [Neomicrococcus lactis]|uniref:Sensor histidine kinase n=1 Tax=Neomicrococcus lactis TaxID=732241 RepID=A0A7W9DBT5_9MICC|nr:hypothetical protein [Neomicrococcus lactis]MBB5598985.1 hypothetical protein [Neomicrococcus lactis]
MSLSVANPVSVTAPERDAETGGGFGLVGLRGRAAAIGGTVWTDTTPGYFWLYAQLAMTPSAAVTP